MRAVSVDETKLKDIFKKAIVEVLEERRELLTELIDEALEDEAMTRAIKEGEKSKRVPRAQVFKALKAGQ
jgi:hypothetical protein